MVRMGVLERIAGDLASLRDGAGADLVQCSENGRSGLKVPLYFAKLLEKSSNK